MKYPYNPIRVTYTKDDNNSATGIAYFFWVGTTDDYVQK
jgi:hypothetical protein